MLSKIFLTLIIYIFYIIHQNNQLIEKSIENNLNKNFLDKFIYIYSTNELFKFVYIFYKNIFYFQNFNNYLNYFFYVN